MNYITNVSQDRLHNQKSYPKIYPYKPDKRYIKTTARKDILDIFFRTVAFADFFYLLSTILVMDHDLDLYSRLPFDCIFYFDD